MAASLMPVTKVKEVMELLETEADPQIRAELAGRYGIHSDHAYGIPMRRLKAIAKPLAPTTIWLSPSGAPAAMRPAPSLNATQPTTGIWSRKPRRWRCVQLQRSV